MENKTEQLKMFLVGSTFMICFGLVDNGGLWLGFSIIDEWLRSLGFTPLVSALLGNTFSDQLGVLLGGSISALLYRLLKVKENKISLRAQFFGITVGCLIPALLVIAIQYLYPPAVILIGN